MRAIAWCRKSLTIALNSCKPGTTTDDGKRGLTTLQLGRGRIKYKRMRTIRKSTDRPSAAALVRCLLARYTGAAVDGSRLSQRRPMSAVRSSAVRDSRACDRSPIDKCWLKCLVSATPAPWPQRWCSAAAASNLGARSGHTLARPSVCNALFGGLSAEHHVDTRKNLLQSLWCQLPNTAAEETAINGKQ